ncbi:MAG: RNA polymerase sigma factor [Clostridia bacterium]|nr:RNA polymerase sigma factor [Clostridia bacterium]
MTEQNVLIEQYESEYIAKVYGFCRMKLGGDSEAADMAQEISLQVIRSIRGGYPVENLGAFVWSVSNHVFCNLLRSRKRSRVVYGADYMPVYGMIPSEDDPEAEWIRREEVVLLRRQLAMMQKNWRQTIILHYFEERSCDDIAGKLGVPVGTVKWWLYDARKAIRKGMNQMNETFGEKSYRPGKLCISCQYTPGADGEPMSCAKSLLNQNILLAAYKKPLTIRELCGELGIAAPYMEDAVAYLVENQLMREAEAEKYQTDFVIMPGANGELGNRIYRENFPAFGKALFAFLEEHRKELTSPAINPAGFTWERLLWVYIQVIVCHAIDHYRIKVCDVACGDRIPYRPNGGRWIALGFDDSINPNTQEWHDYHPSDGPVHRSGGVQGYFHKWSGTSSQTYFDLPEEVFDLCRRFAEGKLDTDALTEEDKFHFGIAIEKKLITRTEQGYRQNYYYANTGACKRLIAIAEDFYSIAKPYFDAAWKLVLDIYLPTMPKHLEWQKGNLFANNLNMFINCSYYDAVKEGLLSEPDDNRYWLSLFLFDREAI